ncbi:PIN/TRAM domain-containing protein [Pediococcus acidilactici]|uniref:PIN/TRAM domain-containing protein n=1 Tax=Pediococcus acidilactici TaxID=1254 RepID=UPI000FFE20DE|nr:PIN/TRAM domain-containing protein [Pediococcus acidilactici]QAT20285.1 PIN/TRAM domain-containing protein [Pediococcus acidilactici]
MKDIKKRIVQAVFALAGGALGMAYLPLIWLIFKINTVVLLNNRVTNFLIGAVIFWILSIFLTSYVLKMMKRIEKALIDTSPLYLITGSIGTVLGLVIAILISTLFYRSHVFFVNTVIPLILMLMLGYLGYRLGTTRFNEWKKLFQTRKRDGNNQVLDRRAGENYHHYKILDTNILIDGRIYDLVKTGLLEGTLLVPNFVLYELQYIADSADSIKRVRGRRGLDFLNKLQSEKIMPIEMYEGDYEEIEEVDSKLIQLAKDKDAVIVTNDYNLNKVSQFQNVQVLNINELANALKPRVIPGESMSVHVVKNGTERQQGVAYLDDGTMVVVEDGKFYIGKTIEVIVTSAIQTDAGRMIFAKPMHSTKEITHDKPDEKEGKKPESK